MVLDKLPLPGPPTIWITVGQGPTAFAVGAGGGCLDIFTLGYPFYPLFPSLWETAQYRLKYCLKGPLNRKQPTNQNPVISMHVKKQCSSPLKTIPLKGQACGWGHSVLQTHFLVLFYFARSLTYHQTYTTDTYDYLCWRYFGCQCCVAE